MKLKPMRKYLLPLLALVVMGCSGSNKNLEEKLRDAVMEAKTGPKGYHTIQLADLTDFEWEKMYYFQPYENKKDISDALGFKWEGDEVKAGFRRLLFVHGEEVVSFLDYNYDDFPLVVYGCGTDRWVYPKSRSEFASFKYCENDKEVYAFIPVPCVENVRDLMARKCPAGTQVAE